jgi:hypothetical protein
MRLHQIKHQTSIFFPKMKGKSVQAVEKARFFLSLAEGEQALVLVCQIGSSGDCIRGNRWAAWINQYLRNSR